MNKTWRMAMAAVALALTLGAAGEDVARHREENLTSFVFHFGGGEGEKAVTPEAMREFVEEYIVPRFPTGTTVQEGRGQWQNPDSGDIIREQSYVLALECYPGPNNRTMIEDIAKEYVRRNTAANVSCFVKVYPGVTTELYYINE